MTQDDRGVAGAQAEVARAIALSREPDAILDLIVDRARTALAAQRCFVIQVGADERIRITASRGLISRSRELLPRHRREGVSLTAIAERRPVWSRDVLNDPAIELSPVSRAFIEGEGYRAALGIPLLADTRVLGVLMTCRDPGRVLATGRAAWIMDVTRDTGREVRHVCRASRPARQPRGGVSSRGRNLGGLGGQ